MSRAFALIVAAVLLTRTGFAQPMDHLKCYKVKDRLKLSAVADLNSTLGVDLGCSISRAKYFCVPATKSVTQSNVQPIPVSGQELTDERICYKIKCSKPFPADQDVIDQFGERTVTGLKPAFICTPARPATCGGTPGQCAGDCPNPDIDGCYAPVDCQGNQLPCGCHILTTTTCPSTTSTSSTTTTLFVPCGGTPGQCAGDCPNPDIDGCYAPVDCQGNQLPCGCHILTTTTCPSTTSTSSTTTTLP